MDNSNENANRGKTDDNRNQGYHLINAMEEIVIQKARVTIPYDDEVCKCEKCFYDICAIVLNTLPPKYSTTDKGSLFVRVTQLDKTDTVQISVEIAKAIELVKKRPSH